MAVCEGRRVGRDLGTIPNHPEAVRKLLKRLGDFSSLRVCYEAGPTGYVLYRQLVQLGIHCEVVAPSLVPKRPGERIKTDRRDALRLAQAYRSGELVAVWVPDAAHEALRDLVRAREVAKKDETRAKHRLSKFLLRYGCRPDTPARAWSHYYRQQRDKGATHHAALRALAFKWTRILFKCWQNRAPYDESKDLKALQNRGSSLLSSAASSTGQS